MPARTGLENGSCCMLPAAPAQSPALRHLLLPAAPAASTRPAARATFGGMQLPAARRSAQAAPLAAPAVEEQEARQEEAATVEVESGRL